MDRDKAPAPEMETSDVEMNTSQDENAMLHVEERLMCRK